MLSKGGCSILVMCSIVEFIQGLGRAREAQDKTSNPSPCLKLSKFSLVQIAKRLVQSASYERTNLVAGI